jgi:hypothetical protein
MYNEEIYQKMKAEFGPMLMPAVTNIISKLHHIKYQAAKNTDALNEYDYERDWWLEKHRELVKIEDEQLCQE